MHAQYLHPLIERHQRPGKGGRQAVLRILGTGEAAHEPLARYPENDGASEAMVQRQ